MNDAPATGKKGDFIISLAPTLQMNRLWSNNASTNKVLATQEKGSKQKCFLDQWGSWI